MEQGTLLQSQLPLHAEFTIPSDPDSYNTYPEHTYHTGGSTVDHLGRRDGTLSQHTTNAFQTHHAPSSHPHAIRLMSDCAISADANSCSTAHNFTDSSSGSISTSPSSASSSLAYTNYPANTYASIPAYSGAVQPFIPASYSGTRVKSVHDGPSSGMLPPPLRCPSNSSHFNASERDVYAAATPYLNRAQLSPTVSPSYASFPETPRSVISATAGLSLSSPQNIIGYSSHMASSSAYTTNQIPCSDIPWPNLEILLELTSEGQSVTPDIHAKVEKGFFQAPDERWTCYRRNYFSVTTSFDLHPPAHNSRIYLKRNNELEQVQAMGMRLSAVVDTPQGKAIDLIQHTPKRDNGPKNKPQIQLISPTHPASRHEHSRSIYQLPMQASYHLPSQNMGPYLPLQHVGDSGASSIAQTTPSMSAGYPYPSTAQAHPAISVPVTTHTFERVQFKQATANNGKRRAQQQFFHLIAELFADVRKDDSSSPNWIKVAHRFSDKIVVRGRSPSHYNDNSQHAATGRNGSASGGSGYASAGAINYNAMNPGSFRSSTATYGNTMGGASAYRSHYGLQGSSDHSGSSPESAGEDLGDGSTPIDTPMSEADRGGFQQYEGYQYYPSTIYEGNSSNQLPPLTKIEGGSSRYTTEPRQYAVKTEYPESTQHSQWPNNYTRFQGVQSSRGFFPALSTSSYS